jgi:O-antigen ligase
MGVLALCRSLASLVYGLVFAPVLLFLRPRLQLRLAVAAGLLVLAYPVLRTADLFPTGALLVVANRVSEERAASLYSRFSHEEQLLEKARERLMLGWGPRGRHRIYDEHTGQDISLTDGFWIIQLGSFGLLGFGSFFALLLWPIFVTARNIRRVRIRSDGILFGTVALILTVRLVDLLPNAFVSSFAVFLAGGLHGAVRAYQSAKRQPHQAMTADRAPAAPARGRRGVAVPGALNRGRYRPRS